MDQVQTAETLVNLGFTSLIIQKGKGSYAMQNLMLPHETQKTLSNGLEVSCFEYVPSVAELVERASLIICHAGAGSVFEGLRAKKTLIVIPNPVLMDNHQIELAHRLERMGHLISATPQTLITKLQSAQHFRPVPYEAGEASGMVRCIDELFPRVKRKE